MPKLHMHVEIERLPLKSPFRISGYTFTEIPVAVVTLRSGSHAGRGEAAGVYYFKDSPEQIANSIVEGRALGMPAWGAMLTDAQVWQLTRYISALRTPDEPDPPAQ